MSKKSVSFARGNEQGLSPVNTAAYSADGDHDLERAMRLSRALVLSKIACLSLFVSWAWAIPFSHPFSRPFSPGRALLLSPRQHGTSEGGSSNSTATDATAALRKQMQNPAEILGVLLIIGGDIVQKAIAQLAGTSLFWLPLSPVAFSFGWASYSFGATMSVFGDGSLMPDPEDELFVINLKSGTKKKNESWLLFRLIRDLELRDCKGEGTSRWRSWKRKPERSSIRFYKDMGTLPVKKPTLGFLSVVSAVIIVSQFVLAAAPLWLHGNWDILMITGIGALLAVATASLPQWAGQKYQGEMSRRPQSFVVTRGNGHPHSFVLEDMRLNLEHLAVVRPDMIRSATTKIFMLVSAACWIILLIAVSGLERDTWYLFGVGALGMVQNLAMAGLKRNPRGHGIPLEKGSVQHGQGMEALLRAAEEQSEGVGVALLDIFFEGTILSEDSEEYWQGKRNAHKQRWRKQLEKKRNRTQGLDGPASAAKESDTSPPLQSQEEI